MHKRHGAEDNNAVLASDLPRDFSSHLLVTSGLDTIFKNHKATTDPEACRLFQKNLNLAGLENESKVAETVRSLIN